MSFIQPFFVARLRKSILVAETKRLGSAAIKEVTKLGPL